MSQQIVTTDSKHHSVSRVKLKEHNLCCLISVIGRTLDISHNGVNTVFICRFETSTQTSKHQGKARVCLSRSEEISVLFSR